MFYLSSSVLKYLVDVKGAPRDRNSLIREISFTRGILSTLNENVNNAGVYDKTWSATIRLLEDPDGPLCTLTRTLQQLATTLQASASATGFQKAANSLQWPYKQKEAEKILRIIERQKSMLLSALDNDHIAIRTPQVDQTPETPLWWAARNSNTAMVKLLLEAGANVESKDSNSQTPLWWAARNSNIAIVKLLLEAGANIESKDSNGQTPLWWAARISNTDMVKLLLEAGANFESKDSNSETPLWWAARNSNIAIVKLLLEAGANIESKDSNGQTPLWWAAWISNTDMVKLLLEAGANIESKDSNSETPLLRAARNSNIAIVKLLLEAGANIESKDSNGQPPLWWAARNNNIAMVTLLLEAGANIELKDSNSQTPLLRWTRNVDALRNAVERFDVQAVQNLLTQAFTDVARDNFKWLHELVEIGYKYQDIANLLMDEKKDSPWILIEPPERSQSTIIVDLHQPFCVHQGGNELTFSPKLVAEDESILHTVDCSKSDLPGLDSIKRKVAASCGLAGVIPVSSDRQEWIGSVAFDVDDSAVASVAYELDLSHTPSTIQDCLLRVEAALNRLVHIISLLQQNGLCCNSFTTLKLLAEVERVEVIRVPFSLISHLVEMVSCLQSTERKRETLISALEVAQEILGLVYGVERDEVTPFDLQTLDMESAERSTVHNCALATQSLCLGLLSYSNAHAGPIQPFFLNHALKRVKLLGIAMHLPNKQCLSAELVELTCFGQMIGNAVVAFACTKKPIHSRKYDLLASPEDLIDTWGPGRFVIDRSSTEVKRLRAVEIGGGIIRPTAENANLFHWDRAFLNYENLRTRFDFHTKIIIAATKLNESCPLDQSQIWKGCIALKNLGTCQDYWRLAEIQAGSQAGQYTLVVQIVRYILGILGDTGYNRQNDELVIAFPSPEDPFRCFRIPCKNDQHLWTRALADSEVCATYAYITPNCLETDKQKCQKSSVARWRNRAVSLDTAVCQHKSSKEIQDQAVTWNLKPGILYWIGKPGTNLTAKVLMPTAQLEMLPTAQLEMRLSITRSLIPESFLRRISSLQKIPMQRIREKQQSTDINATQVLILPAQKSDS
ncbi:ankyrin repeat-containing protein [Rutstroemia sp. NJR-2017a BVV2]|nr:ankyrin repeat-containing protein [Rutstroemia sp. NJR-2017a BVV2]PQE19702.1 ankyrin repeat-containing protein [Rutstroemia sp. NJR-2017a BVV2]